MEILYDNYSSALYGVILRIVQKDEIAEDVLQETCLKIWNNFKQYNASKGRLFTWIINVARNTAIDKIRSREFANAAKNRNVDDSVDSVNLKQYHSFNPETIGIKEMVNNLEKEHKEIIDLMYFKGYTQIEVALKLHIPLGTVKTRARTAIMKLRKYFEKNVK